MTQALVRMFRHAVAVAISRDDDSGGHRVESGDRDAEVVGDAQCEHGDDERQRDEADEEDGDTGGRSEGPAHQ